MSTKTISNYLAAGYALGAQYAKLKLTRHGGVGGYGVRLPFTASVANRGTIHGTNAGITAYAYAEVVNRAPALIEGYDGLIALAGARVANLGRVIATGAHGIGVDLRQGGSVVNGSSKDTTALIEGVGVERGVGGGIEGQNASVSVTNYGRIDSTQGYSVRLDAGGTVTNGALADTTALIGGYGGGVSIGGSAATVANFGTIGNTNYAYGVVLTAGGVIINGAASDTTALIDGSNGVHTATASATVFNFGTIHGPRNYGVNLGAGGLVANGSPDDTTALISGLAAGIYTHGGPTVIANFGTISGFGEAIILESSGTITNGSNADTTALITAYHGLSVQHAAYVANYGTIHSDDLDGNGIGVWLGGGGEVTNGSAADTAALITGDQVVIGAYGSPAAIANYGTIVSEVRGGGDGVLLKAGGSLTNGSEGDTTALIGNSGVVAYGVAAIANFGTIQKGVGLRGSGSLVNGSVSDRVAFIGGAGAAGAASTIINYATIANTEVSEEGAFIDTGAGLTNGSASDASALIDGDVGVAAYGSSTVTNLAMLEGREAGVRLNASTLVNGSASNTAALVQGAYNAVEAIEGPATIANFAVLQGVATYGVEFEQGGVIVNGSAGDTTATIEGRVGVFIRGAATLTNFGTILGTGGTAIDLHTPGDVLVVEAGSAFQGAVLGHRATLILASGVGTLSNVGGGQVTVSGSMAPTTFSNFTTVEIGVGATFVCSEAASIDTGDSLIDAGGLLTLGALANNGFLAVKGGVLDVEGGVTGSGAASINGGTLAFVASFSQNVTFTGVKGTLELADSQGFTNSIAGFSTAGRTTLDLNDIGFVSAGEATFSGTASGGVLTVTGEGATAQIDLVGDYLDCTFVASSDGHGGTSVVAASGAGAIPPHALISAMAAFGPSPAQRVHPDTAGPGRDVMLSAPRTMTA